MTITKNKKVTTDANSAVTRNLLWMVWSGSISIANSVVLWIFIARMRDVEEMGRFTIVMGLYALFFNVCSLGLIPFLVNEISRRKEQRDTSALPKKEQTITGFISSAAILLLLSGIGCAVLMTICGFLISESWSVRISTLILSLAIIPTGVIGVAEATAVSFGRTRLIAFVSTLENLLRTAIPFALIWFGFDISVICASFVLVRFTALLPYLWAVRRKLSSFAFNAADFSQTLKVSPTFGGTIILASINWQAAIILLGLLSTEAESAKYGVASRFLIPVSILMASYANVIQPVIARYTESSIENAGSYLSKMLRYPLILSTIAAIASPFLSRQVLTIFFGNAYAEAAATLNVLAMSVVPFCLVMIVSRGLIATNSQHIDFFANALGVVTCIVAGLLLIPRYGATGAADAQLLSFVSMALIETCYLSRKIINLRFWQKACISLSGLMIIYSIIWKL
jgi:O-antigen/teichoic acid export membrane protein